MPSPTPPRVSHSAVRHTSWAGPQQDNLAPLAQLHARGTLCSQPPALTRPPESRLLLRRAARCEVPGPRSPGQQKGIGTWNPDLGLAGGLSSQPPGTAGQAAALGWSGGKGNAQRHPGNARPSSLRSKLAGAVTRPWAEWRAGRHFPFAGAAGSVLPRHVTPGSAGPFAPRTQTPLTPEVYTPLIRVSVFRSAAAELTQKLPWKASPCSRDSGAAGGPAGVAAPRWLPHPGQTGHRGGGGEDNLTTGKQEAQTRVSLQLRLVP